MNYYTPFLEVTKTIYEAGGEDLKKCYQCGTCTAVCPWGSVREFSPRYIFKLAQHGLEGYEGDELWLCSTCRTCVDRCPRGVGIIDVFTSMRSIIAQTGLIPPTLRTVLGSINSNGNPWAGKREDRNIWAKELDIKKFQSGTEYLYFSCCAPSYDPRTKKLAVATSRLLKEAGIDFGIFGKEESCCGESIRKTGDYTTYEKLLDSNISLFNSNGVKKIIAQSPHCLHSFKNEYPSKDGNYETVHYTQILFQALKNGKLKAKKGFNKKVTYHDPCYLGRHNGIYDEPREILKSIPELNFVEMLRVREQSFCCGGGGARMWMETPKEERFGVLRIKEALSVGAEVIATACPYCIQMLEDGRTALGVEDRIQVMDISEILSSVVF
jgi:Fe-S oxidoreductase